MKQMIGITCFVLAATCAFAVGAAEQTAVTRPAASTGIRTGRCHCGAIAFQVGGPIIRSTYCDCRACQKASGALKTPYVTVLRTDFKVTTGKPASFRGNSKEKCDCYGVWHFCRTCGGPLYWESDNGKELDVFAAAFDDPSVFQPKA